MQSNLSDTPQHGGHTKERASHVEKNRKRKKKKKREKKKKKKKKKGEGGKKKFQFCQCKVWAMSDSIEFREKSSN